MGSKLKNKIPMFVINLKKDVKRRSHMEDIAKKLDLEFAFVDAVYGKDMDPSEINKVCNPIETNKRLKRELFLGEIGVILSQMSVYQKMLDEGISQAAIFEDDVVIDEGIHEVLESLDKLPKNWELALLGYHRHSPLNKYDRISFRSKIKISKNYKSVRFTEPMHGAYGYLINLEGAKKLLNILKKGLVLPLDLYTGDSRYINVCGVFPKCVDIDLNLISTIDEDRDLYFGLEGEHKPNNIDIKDKIKTFKQFLRIQKRELSCVSKRLIKPIEYK